MRPTPAGADPFIVELTGRVGGFGSGLGQPRGRQRDVVIEVAVQPPRRVRCHLNRSIQWHDPPFDPLRGRMVDESLGWEPGQGMEGVAPDLWAMEVGFVMDRIWASKVGRALIVSVRRRTTLYQWTGPAQTDPDSLEGDEPGSYGRVPDEAYARATSPHGYMAIIRIDLARRARPNEHGLPRTRESALVHELAHAVRINWGLYQVRTRYPRSAHSRIGAPSPEEEAAWLIENMYRYEVGLPGRSRYHAGGPLHELPTRAGTRTELDAIERRVTTRWSERARVVAERLARLPPEQCPYNPFRRLHRGHGVRD